MNEREPKFWTCLEDPERLYHTDIGEAVVEYCEDIHPDQPPETVKVYGYAPVPKPDPERWARGYHVERLLEDLDEEHGDPDTYTEPTEAMKAAEVAFVRAVLAEYKVWTCEIVATETVRVLDHVDADWLNPATPTPEES